MLAMALKSFGADAPFEPVALEARAPGAGEVAIEVRATSINPVDTKIRAGGRAIAPEDPCVLGCDLAGVVAAVGEGVDGFAVGDAVYGCAGGVKGRDGAYAERMIADARLIAQKPRALSFREAAALPLVGITAWNALYDRGRLAPGEPVLVHGGAGGVGHIGVQLARAAGGVVHSTVSSAAKAQIARDLGADVALDYRARPLADQIAEATGGEGYPLVFDTIGGPNIAPSLEALAIDGRCVSIVSFDTAPDLSALHQKNASLHLVFMLIPMLTGRGLEAHGRILRRLAALVDAGRVRPLLDETRFSLREVGAAHARLTSGAAIGKVVVDVP